jgi:hypothetical protein
MPGRFQGVSKRVVSKFPRQTGRNAGRNAHIWIDVPSGNSLPWLLSIAQILALDLDGPSYLSRQRRVGMNCNQVCFKAGIAGYAVFVSCRAYHCPDSRSSPVSTQNHIFAAGQYSGTNYSNVEHGPRNPLLDGHAANFENGSFDSWHGITILNF